MRKTMEYFLEEYKYFVNNTMQYFNIREESDVLQPYMKETKYIGSSKFKKFYPKLKACKLARNALSHEMYTLDKVPLFYPNDELFACLEEVNKLLLKEPICSDVMIKIKDLCTKEIVSNVLDTVKFMVQRHYTYIPIVDEKNHIVGLFSEYTVFRAVMSDDILYFAENSTTFERIQDLISLDVAIKEDSVFVVSGDEKIKKIIAMIKGNNILERFGCILVTSDGTKKGSLLGMLTSWDIAEEL